MMIQYQNRICNVGTFHIRFCFVFIILCSLGHAYVELSKLTMEYNDN